MTAKLAYELKPLDGSFGVEISGLRLDCEIDEAVAREIVRLLFRYQLLLFRGRKLDPARQVSLSRSLGEVEPHRFHPGQLADHPEIFRVSNARGDGHVYVGHYWHS